MRFLQLFLLTILGIVSLVGCASSDVFFFDRATTIVQVNDDGSKSVKLYIDAFGTPYPADGLPTSFTPPRFGGYDASLHNLATGKAPLCQNNPIGETALLCAVDSLNDLQSYQSEVWENRAQEIFNQVGDDPSSSIVVFLVHGFNVLNSDEDFTVARQRILDHSIHSGETVFVEVNWDGKKLKPGNRAWGNAQSSGPLIGFELRQLFNHLTALYAQSDRKIPPVKFVTHSSGAFVTGAIFGNPIAALPNLQDALEDRDPSYEEFYAERFAEDGPNGIPKLPDLSIGMFAAATSSLTFTGGTEYNRSGFLLNGAKIYSTINPDDSALKKIIFSPNIPILGASGLGADISVFCNLPESFKGRTQATALDFLRDPDLGEDVRTHSFQQYMTQSQSDDFFKLLLGSIENSEYELPCQSQ